LKLYGVRIGLDHSPRCSVFVCLQEAALLSRPAIVAAIEELERIICLIKVPLQQDITAAASKARVEGEAAAVAAAPRPTKSDVDWEREKRDAAAKARSKAIVESKSQAKADAKKAADRAARDAINSIVELLYWAAVFDPYLPYSIERHACLSYATHSDVDLIPEDLDAIGFLGKLLTARPYGASISHSDAVAQCKQLAGRYVLSPEEMLQPMSMNGRKVKSKLEIIKKLEFCTLMPGMPAVHVPVAPTVMPSPAILPGPLVAPEPVAVSGGKGENLVSAFFGTANNHQQQSQRNPPRGVAPHNSSILPTAPINPSGPPAFAGDSELGIEGVELDSDSQRRAAVAKKSDENISGHNEKTLGDDDAGSPFSNSNIEEQPKNLRKPYRGRRGGERQRRRKQIPGAPNTASSNDALQGQGASHDLKPPPARLRSKEHTVLGEPHSGSPHKDGHFTRRG